METITIPKKLSRGDDLVVVRRKAFEAFRKWQKEMDEVLAKVRRGRKEYKTGKTIVASSPRSFR